MHVNVLILDVLAGFDIDIPLLTCIPGTHMTQYSHQWISALQNFYSDRQKNVTLICNYLQDGTKDWNGEPI